MDLLNIDLPVVVLLSSLFISFIILLIYSIRQKKEINKIKNKYSKIINIEEEVKKLQSIRNKLKESVVFTKKDYLIQQKKLKLLLDEVAIYNEEVTMAEMGFYKSHFDFDTSEKYKIKIDSVRKSQASMITSKNAIFCTQAWTVGGSASEGKKMIERAIKLTARAFNNECDAAISNARWNNMDRMEARIKKAFDSINNLNKSNSIIISKDYLNLKIDELRLKHEYENKRQIEKEEQQEIKQRMKEEAKIERELERSLKEEEKYEEMLRKAKLESEKLTGNELELLNQKILKLTEELETAKNQAERAKSMAQQTKKGNVYIISNIGSFGDGVYKIGMTRRLDPLDRVRELGDASVPFLFDVHAMIFSDDAPGLENALHKKFNHMRVNLVNNKKEFFKVSLEQVKREVLKISPDAEFIETAEAKEYRESQIIRANNKKLHKEQLASRVESFTTA